MIYLNLFFILIFVSLLIKDYSLTKGMFMKAKIFHAIAIACLFSFFRTSWLWLNWFVLKASKMDLLFRRDYGIFSGSFMKIDYIINSSLGAIATIAAVGLLTRNALSRKILLNLIPFLILTTTVQAYSGIFTKRTDEINDYFLLVLCLIATSLLLGWIYLLYKSKFMIEFFDNKTKK
jgi:hypothetical protein